MAIQNKVILVLFLTASCLLKTVVVRADPDGFLSREKPDFFQLYATRGSEAGFGSSSFRAFRGGGPGSLGASLNLSVVDQELGHALFEALGHGHGLSPEEMEAKTARMRPMFESMPKNIYGRIGRDAMEYMIARYFGAEHGWTIKGFDPASRAKHNKSLSATIGEHAEFGHGANVSAAMTLRQKLPGYVEAVIEERLDQHGFGLHEVVTFMVVMERLIWDENMAMLEDAYWLQKKETSQLLTRLEVLDLTVTYMLIYAFSADRRNRTDFPQTLKKIRRGYPNGWPSGKFAIAETDSIFAHDRRANPFLPRPKGGRQYGFDVPVRAVTKMSQNYGKWTNMMQCRQMKDALVELDVGRDNVGTSRGTGRVPLVDFYLKGNVSSNWWFEERLEYLRALGALDESSATKGPQLIIPNYVQGPGNCLEVSSFYSICCLKECESLLGKIEDEIREPEARPSRILPVVQRLIDAREETPWNLTAVMISQLELVAEQHGGKVPLHGRLFAQWLHYVFPHDCPYPQRTSELENGVTAAAFRRRTGVYPLLNSQEVSTYIKENLGYSRKPILPWTVVPVPWIKGSEVSDADDELLRDVDNSVETLSPQNESVVASSEQESEEAWLSQWVMEEELYVGYHHQGPRSATFGGSAGFFSFVASRLAALGVLFGGFYALLPFAKSTWAEFNNGCAEFGKTADLLKKPSSILPSSTLKWGGAAPSSENWRIEI